MTVLDTIRNTLLGLVDDPKAGMRGVVYGAFRATNDEKWNYFVFNRIRTVKASNRLDPETYYGVYIVHEDYIPEGYVETVVNALESQNENKLRSTADEVRYEYTFKGGTDMVVEIAQITFVHPEKRC